LIRGSVGEAISASQSMPRAYSDDLRCKLLEGYEAGRGTLRELATQFGVSWGYSKKIRAQQLRSGQKERPKQSQHGPASRVSPLVQQQLRSALRQQPDLTLAELQQRIEQTTGVGLSRSWLWLWLQRLGLRHKKNRSARKNKRAVKTSGGGKRGGSR
jgi:transposase